MPGATTGNRRLRQAHAAHSARNLEPSHGFRDSLRNVRRIEFGTGIFQVGYNGGLGDVEYYGRFPGRFSPCCPEQDFLLSSG